MILGLLKEPPHETRVSLLPEAVASFTKKGITVIVEQGAGERSFASDADYEKTGVQIKNRNEVLQADIVLTINAPMQSEIGNLKSNILIGVFQPLFNIELMKSFASNGITIFSLDLLP